MQVARITEVPVVSVRLTFDVKLRAAFRVRGHRSGVLLGATNGSPAGARCKQHDAAPVLFGRAASAAGKVRRLGSLNAKLGSCSEACQVTSSRPSFARAGLSSVDVLDHPSHVER